VTYIPQVDAKIKRAIELIDELDILCKTYLNAPNFYIDKQLVEPNKWDLVLGMHEKPPLKLGILVGEIVHNIRSSLDIGLFHYLREASPDSFSGLSNWALRGINFPIFDSEKDFSSEKWHCGLAEAQHPSRIVKGLGWLRHRRVIDPIKGRQEHIVSIGQFARDAFELFASFGAFEMISHIDSTRI
jgi:hypothetical protein